MRLSSRTNTRRKLLLSAMLGANLLGSFNPVYAVGLRSSNELREEIATAQDRVAAITQAATESDRDLTDEEQTEVDNILGRGTPGAQNYSAGRIALLQAALERAERIEANQAALASNRASQNREQHSGGSRQPGAEDSGIVESRIIIPATARRLTTFRAFKVNDSRAENERDAYTAGRFFLATLYNHEPSRQWCNDNGIQIVRAAQSGGVDGKGGFLVPTSLEAAIIMLRESRGIARRLAEQVDMPSDVHDSPKRTAGAAATWKGEGVIAAESDVTWANVQLIANKLLSLVLYSSEISEDAIIKMADNLTAELAYAHADEEDKAMFLGDGTATYGGFTGILNAVAAGAIYTAGAGKDTYDEWTLTDFQAVVAKLPEYADDGASWNVNKRFYNAAMAPIIDAAGGNSGGDRAMGTGRKQYEFLGYPVNFVGVLPKALTSLANQKIGVFGDIRQGVKLGDRAGFEVFVSEHYKMANDQLAIRGRSRSAIKVHELGDTIECGSLCVMQMGAA